MASTRNAFELLNGEAPVVGKSKKKKGKPCNPQQIGGLDSNAGSLTSGRILENEAGGSLDDFTPALRKGKARENRIGAIQTVKEAAILEARAAAQASSAEEILELWDSWTCKLVSPSDAAPLYRGDNGQLVSFHEVLRLGKALEASLEATFVTPLPTDALSKLETLLQHALPAEAQEIASSLPGLLWPLQELLWKTGTPDVVKASQEAVSKLVSAANVRDAPGAGPDEKSNHVSDLLLDAEAAQNCAANAESPKEQMDHLEKAESLTRQALLTVCGKTGGAGKLPVDAGDALERLKALVTRQLTQAKDGASGFQQAVAEELQQLGEQAKVLDSDIKEAEKRLQDLREARARISASISGAKEKATRGPTEGELNVEAFEGQLRAVEQLAASLTVKTVLTPTSPESDFSQLASQAVTAQVHSLESLLTSYCAAQKGNVEKAQQAGARLLKNMQRAEQLSLMNMVEEKKTNAKLLEKDQAALKELYAQAMSLVNRASESVKSLASLGQVGSGVDLQALEARVDELLTAIKSGAEGIKAFQNPKQGKASNRAQEGNEVAAPKATHRIKMNGVDQRDALVEPIGDAEGQHHVTAHVALGVPSEVKPTENGHLQALPVKPANGSLGDDDFISAASKKRRNRRPNQAVVS